MGSQAPAEREGSLCLEHAWCPLSAALPENLCLPFRFLCGIWPDFDLSNETPLSPCAALKGSLTPTFCLCLEFLVGESSVTLTQEISLLFASPSSSCLGTLGFHICPHMDSSTAEPGVDKVSKGSWLHGEMGSVAV